MSTSRVVLGILLIVFVPGTILACDPVQSAKSLAFQDRGCSPVTTSTPFVHHPANPVFGAPAWFEGNIDCFSVAGDASGYVLLFTSSHAGNSGFYRVTSPDGITWSEPDTIPSFPRNDRWYGNIKCPDLGFRDGDLHLYFKGNIAESDPVAKAFGYAFSGDRGLTWRVHPEPVLTQTEPYEADLVDAPSVVRYGSQYVMSYMTKAVVGTNWRFYSCIAFSDDGITWTKHEDNPVLEPSLGSWYDYAAGRPRLLVDPYQPLLHLVFSGTAPVERCARFGRAISLDGGQSWTIEPLPILDLPEAAGMWNDGSIWCSSFAWNAARDSLSLYYVGASSSPGVDKRFGVAKAAWPLASPVHVPPPEQTESSLLKLVATPNPFAGQIAFQLSSAASLPAARVSIRVYDVSGRFIKELWTGAASAMPAAITWDGLNENGAPTAAGRYLVRVSAGNRLLGNVRITRLR